MKKKHLILFFILNFSHAISSQIVIKGKILDENKKPLTGANILAFPPIKAN